MSRAKPSRYPQWDGFGNRFEWILEQARLMRGEKKPLPDLRLFIAGQQVELPQQKLKRKA